MLEINQCLYNGSVKEQLFQDGELDRLTILILPAAAAKNAKKLMLVALW